MEEMNEDSRLAPYHNRSRNKDGAMNANFTFEQVIFYTH